MKRHILHDVDLDRQSALCAVCGYAEIYVAKTRSRSKPRVLCINKARELWLRSKSKQSLIREEKRSQSDWKQRHVLSEINADTLRATCTVCGRTDIQKVTSRGYSRYDCVTKRRKYMRNYHRSHYIARLSNPHALSQIDEEKQTAVCAKCGPVKIEIWLGKKKINRRCINVQSELIQAQQERRKAKNNEAPETL
jgi:hypothetical protein